MIHPMDGRALLLDLMQAENLNPTQLARLTGGKTKQPQIYRFLSGEAKEPRRSTLEPIARVLGVPVEAFFDQRLAKQVHITRFGPGLPEGVTALPVAEPAVAAYTSLTHVAARRFLRSFAALSRVQSAMVLRAMEELTRNPEQLDEVSNAVCAILERPAPQESASTS